MRYFKHSAFSTFEALCVVVIVAVIASVGIRYLGYITHKQCLDKLKGRLTYTQNVLSMYYTDLFIRGDVANPADARVILSHLTKDNTPKCHFVLRSSNLIATIDKQSVSFSIEPSSLALNPKISCSLISPLCKAFGDRILDK